MNGMSACPECARARATASMGAEMSTPATDPFGRTARASINVAVPQPQPISRMCSPGFAAANGMIASVISARFQSMRSCCSAQRWPVRPFQYSICCSFDAAMSLPRLAAAHCQRAQAQRIELDETRGVFLVIGALVVLEGDEVLRIERLL